MTEVKARDYTNSAVNLCNPPAVKEILDRLHAEQDVLTGLEKQLREANQQLVSQIEGANECVATTTSRLKEAIEQYGSYQALDNGWYALKSVRKSKTYHVEPFKEHYPQYITSIVMEAINTKALGGLIKGKLVEDEDLRAFKIITEDITYAFIIK